MSPVKVFFFCRSLSRGGRSEVVRRCGVVERRTYSRSRKGTTVKGHPPGPMRDSPCDRVGPTTFLNLFSLLNFVSPLKLVSPEQPREHSRRIYRPSMNAFD